MIKPTFAIPTGKDLKSEDIVFAKIIDIIYFEANNNPNVLRKHSFLNMIKKNIEDLIQAEYRE